MLNYNRKKTLMVYASCVVAVVTYIHAQAATRNNGDGDHGDADEDDGTICQGVCVFWMHLRTAKTRQRNGQTNPMVSSAPNTIARAQSSIKLQFAEYSSGLHVFICCTCTRRECRIRKYVCQQGDENNLNGVYVIMSAISVICQVKKANKQDRFLCGGGGKCENKIKSLAKYCLKDIQKKGLLHHAKPTGQNQKCVQTINVEKKNYSANVEPVFERTLTNEYFAFCNGDVGTR